jgi:hypothetical protein
VAIMRLQDLKDSGTPRLARAIGRSNDLKPENQERKRRLIELRFSEPDEQTVKHLNLFCNRMIDAESCCTAAQQIIRRTYGITSGLIETRRRIEHAVMVHG